MHSSRRARCYFPFIAWQRVTANRPPPQQGGGERARPSSGRHAVHVPCGGVKAHRPDFKSYERPFASLGRRLTLSQRTIGSAVPPRLLFHTAAKPYGGTLTHTRALALGELIGCVSDGYGHCSPPTARLCVGDGGTVLLWGGEGGWGFMGTSTKQSLSHRCNVITEIHLCVISQG